MEQSPLVKEIISGVLKGIKDLELPSAEIAKIVADSQLTLRDLKEQMLSTGRVEPTTSKERPVYQLTSSKTEKTSLPSGVEEFTW